MHGAVDIRLAGKTRSYRLGLAQIEELEELLDLSVFLIAGAISMALPALRKEQWQHIIRLGMIGGGMARAEADDVTAAMFRDYGVTQCLVIALKIMDAALKRVHGDVEPSGDKNAVPGARTDFGSIYGSSVFMGIPDVGSMSLGQWTAAASGWNRAHGDGKPKAPTDEEFDLAVAAAAGNG